MPSIHSRTVSESIRRAALAALLLAGLSHSAPAQVAATPSDSARRQVSAVVEHYLHGLKFNDVASLRTAFWPEAMLYWVKRDGSLGRLTQEDWYKSFAASAGKEEQGELRIDAIDVAGDIASVKVVETYPKSIYIDYLNLIRLDGRWLIVNKVYTSRSR
jgi:hypothetical protein